MNTYYEVVIEDVVNIRELHIMQLLMLLGNEPMISRANLDLAAIAFC